MTTLRTGIDEIRTQFARVPLFDQSLSEELQELERRQRLAAANDGSLGGRHAVGDTLRGGSPMSLVVSDSSSPEYGAYQGAAAGARTAPGASSSSHARYSRDSAAGSRQQTFTIPPKLTRPWSVEMLVRRSDTLHADLRIRPFHDAESPAAHQQRGHRRSTAARQRNQDAGSAFRSPGRPAAAGIDDNTSPNAADNSSNSEGDAYHRGPRRDGGSRSTAGGGTASAHGGDASQAFLHEAEPLTLRTLEVVAELEHALHHESVEGHIERAAARRLVQRERLKRIGLQPPGAVQDSGVETDKNVTRFQPDTHGVVQQKKVEDHSVAAILAKHNVQTGTTPPPSSTGKQAASADAGVGTSPPRKLQSFTAQRSAAPLVLPASGYVGYQPATAASSHDTVWHQMLIEERNRVRAAERGGDAMQRFGAASTPASTAALDSSATPRSAQKSGGGRSVYQLALQSTANAKRSGELTAATGAAGRRTAGAAEAAAPSVAAPGSVANLLPTAEQSAAASQTKDALLRQLDRMQLESEELLVRNRIFSATSFGAEDGAASSSRSALVPSAPVDPMEHRALGHVAAAHRSTVAEALPPPIGGYGTVDDDSGSNAKRPLLQHQPSDEAERWAAASYQSKLHGAASTTTVNPAAPIRRWASDHADQVPRSTRQATVRPSSSSLLANSTTNFVYAPSGASTGYDARKKWGSVTFASGIPETQSGGTDLNALSSSAQEMMQPERIFAR